MVSMKNNALLLLLSFLIAQMAFANNDEKNQLQTVMPTACHFSGNFVQKKAMQGLPIPLVSEGDFFFSCDLGIIWQTQQPFPEALIYSDFHNYRVSSETNNIERLTSLTHFGMSKIMLKMLNGDVDYFSESFAVDLIGENQFSLSPQSKFMKRAIDKITLQRVLTDDSVSLLVTIEDISQQQTEISIDRLIEYKLDTKQAVRQQCEKLYPNQKTLCEVLRYPGRFNE